MLNYLFLRKNLGNTGGGGGERNAPSPNRRLKSLGTIATARSSGARASRVVMDTVATATLARGPVPPCTAAAQRRPLRERAAVEAEQSCLQPAPSFRSSCGLGPRYSPAAAAAGAEYRLSPCLLSHRLARPYARTYHRPAGERREELPRPATAPSRLPPGAHHLPPSTSLVSFLHAVTPHTQLQPAHACSDQRGRHSRDRRSDPRSCRRSFWDPEGTRQDSGVIW